ncbi:hypothetical protein B0H10DRAFT_1941690 [Mycena sp. CBHHK59/15]|nr:hypothetical protein B0H10DRAFT_1941690 [Mycena sp. CBHHK59/15]
MEIFEVWFHSLLAIFEKQLANPDFKDEIDWAPKHIFKEGKHQFTDLFSGNWSWEQADKITALDPESHGAMFVPRVFGSDKTTVSVGMGNTKFYPFYGGIGNIYNSTQRAHREGLFVMVFLSIPKTTRQYAGSKEFRKFRCQLFHSSIRRILQSLKLHMKKLHITQCADGHFRPAIYGLGPYITDYPEQALLTLIDEDTLCAINRAVAQFHVTREIFRTVRPDRFSLPHQHSMVHYHPLIQAFGAPNGLCSSITESKHIKAVKEPYRHLSRKRPLSQIILTNQHLDKLAAAVLLPLPLPPPVEEPPDDPNDEHVDQGEVAGPTCLGEVKLAKTYVCKVPRDVHQLAVYIGQPRLHELIRCFLFEQLHPQAAAPSGRVPISDCPEFSERVFMYNSACAVFYAPSSVCSIGGMHHERIQAVKSWYRGPPRYNCAFIEHDPDAPGFHGLHAAHVRLLFRFKFRGIDYPCALVQWFSAHGDEHCLDTAFYVNKFSIGLTSKRLQLEQGKKSKKTQKGLKLIVSRKVIKKSGQKRQCGPARQLASRGPKRSPTKVRKSPWNKSGPSTYKFSIIGIWGDIRMPISTLNAYLLSSHHCCATGVPSLGSPASYTHLQLASSIKIYLSNPNSNANR